MDNQFFLDAGIPPLLHLDQPPTPTWHSLLPPSETPFPTDSAVSSDGYVIRELIGKLGNICNSGEIFAHPGSTIGSNLPAMPGDSGFAERAARFSSFRSRSFNCRTTQFGYPNGSGFPSELNSGRKLHRVLSSPSLKLENQNQNDFKVNGFSGNYGVDQGEFGNSKENSSSVSEQTQPGAQTGSGPGSTSSRKRKSVPKPKLKQISSSPPKGTEPDPNAKRIKSSEDEKLDEPPKDYIHVRARRGQATDSHSLAERVRREKISERMKLLQDIVPGCNKVTGKALMLEEIINYVQSLQRQVEFLSMKLASIPSSMEFNASNPFQNDIFQPNCSMQTSSMQQMDALTPNIYGAQNFLHQNGTNQSNGIHLPPTNGFMNGVHELQPLCEGDLHTIIEMGFNDNTIYTG